MADDTPRRAAAAPPDGWLQRLLKGYGYVSDIVTPQRLLLLAALAVLGVVGLIGGWGAVEAEDDAAEVPTVQAGTPFEATPFEVSVRRARHFTELKPTFYPQDGHRYLVVSLDVVSRNDTPVSALLLADAVQVDAPGLKQLALSSGHRPERPTILRGLDSLPAKTFQPGLDSSIVVAWQQAVTEPVPDTVTLTFLEHTWRQSSLDGSHQWFDPTPVARVTLPVEALDGP